MITGENYEKNITTAYAYGIVNGYGNGTGWWRANFSNTSVFNTSSVMAFLREHWRVDPTMMYVPST